MHMKTHQRGSFLLEALIAFLIFAFGVLGLIGLQASSIAANIDTQYRVEANQIAQRMLSTIQSSVTRTSATAFQASLLAFNHYSTGDQCTFTGTAADPATSQGQQVAAWLAQLQSAATTRLPAANGQIRATWGTPNQVRIVICWQQPGLPVPRRHVLTGSIS
jgi:type IV pilus assembly protein PilV